MKSLFDRLFINLFFEEYMQPVSKTSFEQVQITNTFKHESEVFVNVWQC